MSILLEKRVGYNGLNKRVLHGRTVQRTMLNDQHSAVYSYYFSVGKCLLKYSKSLSVFFWLIVCWNKYSTIHY